jgi:threonylcarbamoyladenosine tRNA methylthiotransferase MtaB
MPGPHIITLGCRLNIAESEGLRQALPGRDDLVIINSCAVTAQASRSTRQAIRRARRERPEARVIVTGCGAHVDRKRLEAMAEVDAVIGNAGKANITALLDRSERVQAADFATIAADAPQFVSAFSERVRGFVVVQNGCDHACTFCIIPAGRGPSRSVPMADVVDQVSRLVDAGVREIVLTGVDVTSYGADLSGAPRLGHLVDAVLRGVPSLPRLRLSSLDGIEIDPLLMELLAGEPRLMPHIHLSLQAGDDIILKRMKRRHGRAQAVALVRMLKSSRPEIAIGADIIAGFPTEDEAAFERSLALVEDCGIVHGHIFPFSGRDGTPAARMPAVDPAVVRERAARLRAACADARTRWLTSLIGSRQHMLVETSGIAGHSESFAPVRLMTPQKAGTITSVRITGLEQDALIAQEDTHG